MLNKNFFRLEKSNEGDKRSAVCLSLDSEFCFGNQEIPVVRVLGSGLGLQCLVLEDSRWVSQSCSTSVFSSVFMVK